MPQGHGGPTAAWLVLRRLARPRFGRLARELYGVSSDDLGSGLEHARENGGRLGEILRNRGILDREQTRGILSAQARWTAATVKAVFPEMNLPMRTFFSLCLPAFNEQEVIEDTLDGAFAILPEFVEDFEIVVADDGSRDRTGEILARYAETEPRVRVVTHPKNLGYGAAVSSALRAARGDLVSFIDSDGQFSLLDLPSLLGHLDDHDVVIGYREKRADRKIRLFNAWAWSRLVRLTLGLRVRDLDCAFKLFRRETVENLSLTSRGNCISAEILSFCVRNRLKIKEVPVEHFPRFHGTAGGSTPSVVLRAFGELPSLIKKRYSSISASNGSLVANKNATLRPRRTAALDFSSGWQPSNGYVNHNGHGNKVTDSSRTMPDLPMTICMLAACPFPANYGTPGSIREMAEGVAERGHELHVVTYHMGENIPVRGVHLHRITPLTRQSSVVVGPTLQRPLYDLQMVFKTLQVIRHFRPAVLHAHAYEAAIAAWLCRLVTGIPVIYSGHHTMADELHTYNFLRPRWLARALGQILDRTIPRLADRCIPHSVNMEKFFQERNLLNRTEPIINFGIELQQPFPGHGAAVRQRYGLGDSQVVLYAGLMNQFQRLDLLLEAMRVVVAQQPDAKLLLVTTVKSPEFVTELKKQAEQLGLTGRVVFTEPQPLEAMPEFLSTCDVAVVPRPQVPGFPIKLLNYLAGRKAAVFFSSCATTLKHKESAYLVSPDTGEALGHGILEVLGDRQLRERIAEGGYQYVHANHSRQRTAEQLCDVYLRTILMTGERDAQRAKTQPYSLFLPASNGEQTRRLDEAEPLSMREKYRELDLAEEH